MKKYLLFVIVGLVLMSLVFLAACGEKEGGLKIGVLMAMTGDLGSYGEDISKGAEMAVKDLNEAGGVLDGILGGDVEIIVKDTQTDPIAGVDAAKKLIEIDKVPAIVGALSSGVTIAVAESATIPNKVVQISPASTSPAVGVLDDDDYVSRTAATDALQGIVLANQATILGYEKAASLYVNNEYGQGLKDSFNEAFEKLGGTVTASVPIEQEQPSYDAELRKATEGDPDVLLCLTYPESAKVYLREAIEKDYITTFLFCDGTKSPELNAAIGAQYLEGTYGTAAAAIESDVTRWFREAYEEAYGALPAKPYIPECYDATVIIALAAQKAGKADGTAIRDALIFVANPPGEKIDPGVDGIRKALELLKDGKDINYQGVSGPCDFLDNGDVINTIEVWKIVGGEIVTDRYELPEIE